MHALRTAWGFFLKTVAVRNREVTLSLIVLFRPEFHGTDPSGGDVALLMCCNLDTCCTLDFVFPVFTSVPFNNWCVNRMKHLCTACPAGKRNSRRTPLRVGRARGLWWEGRRLHVASSFLRSSQHAQHHLALVPSPSRARSKMKSSNPALHPLPGAKRPPLPTSALPAQGTRCQQCGASIVHPVTNW